MLQRAQLADERGVGRRRRGTLDQEVRQGLVLASASTQSGLVVLLVVLVVRVVPAVLVEHNPVGEPRIPAVVGRNLAVVGCNLAVVGHNRVVVALVGSVQVPYRTG